MNHRDVAETIRELLIKRFRVAIDLSPKAHTFGCPLVADRTILRVTDPDTHETYELIVRDV